MKTVALIVAALLLVACGDTNNTFVQAGPTTANGTGGDDSATSTATTGTLGGQGGTGGDGGETSTTTTTTSGEGGSGGAGGGQGGAGGEGGSACVPKVCADVYGACGAIDDGCGTPLDCTKVCGTPGEEPLGCVAGMCVCDGPITQADVPAIAQMCPGPEESYLCGSSDSPIDVPIDCVYAGQYNQTAVWCCNS